jgi:hypothetical protein
MGPVRAADMRRGPDKQLPAEIVTLPQKEYTRFRNQPPGGETPGPIRDKSLYEVRRFDQFGAMSHLNRPHLS